MKQNKTEEKKKSLRRVLTGKVVNISNDNMIKVRVEVKYTHKKYKKIVKKHKNYLAHKEKDDVFEKGQIVSIGEIKPISKMKKWAVVKSA